MIILCKANPNRRLSSICSKSDGRAAVGSRNATSTGDLGRRRRGGITHSITAISPHVAAPIIWSGPANEALTPPEAAPPGSLWAAADEGLQPLSPVEEERARLLPLHKRRPLEDELPQPPLKIPGLKSIRSMAAALLLAGLLFFSLPTIIKGFGGFIGAVTATPTPTVDPNPTPTPTPTPPPTPEPIVHIVKRGETLSQISAQYQVSVAAILGANPAVKDPNSIAVGQELIIPSVIPDVSIPPGSEAPASSPSP